MDTQPTTINIPVSAYRETEHRWQQAFRASPARFKLACWHRRARKTTLALNMLVEACCATRDATYGYVGPTYPQTKSIAVVDPMMLKRYLPREVCRKPFNESDLRQEFITGSVLEMKGADKPDSIRGVGWKGVVLEEWAMMRHGRLIWEEILEPILRENKGWALFLFTPKGRNHAYEYFERAKRNATGEWLASYLPASISNLIAPEELVKAREELPERLFQQEFECAFLEGASSVFHNIEACIAGLLSAPQWARRYVLGVDVGRTHDFTVLTVIEIGSNRVVEWVRIKEAAWNLQKELIVMTARRYHNAHIIIDATGFSAGSVVAEQLATVPVVEDLKAASLSVTPFQFTERSKRALVEKLIVALEQRLVTFPDIPELVDELKAFSYETTEFGNLRYGAPEGLYDDAVMSLGLAVWGLGSYLYQPTMIESHEPELVLTGVDNI